MEMNPADGQFLGMVGVNVWSFIGLNASALFSAFVASIAGTAGGLILIGLMALVFPPALLIPVHTIVQLGAGQSRTSRWRYMLWDKLPPFVVGTVIGATIGGQIFFGLSESVLLFILGVSILSLSWVPKLAQFGPEKGRFVLVGFVVTFLGVFHQRHWYAARGIYRPCRPRPTQPHRHGGHADVHRAYREADRVRIAGGQLRIYVPLIATMIVMSFLGTWVGKHAMDRIPERVFRTGFQVLLTLLGFRLVWLAADASFNLN